MEEEQIIETVGTALAEPANNFEDPAAGQIVSFVKEKMQRAEDARRVEEERWLKAYRNYRGIYSPDTQFTEAEKSRVFVKVTKTKVLAAYGQIVDVLFGSDKFPLGISATIVPEGIQESVHFDMQPVPAPSLQPGDTIQKIKERELGALEKKLAPVRNELQPGPGTTATQITYNPAAVTASKMEKKIHDQLDESNAVKKLRKAAFECALFGTGIMKGPFVINKESPKWNEKGEYTPVVNKRPAASDVRIWDFYPDPDASASDVCECEFVIERHKLSRSKLRDLKKRPFFRKKAINKALELGESYIEKWWETSLDEQQTGSAVNRFEALEFWGMIDVDLLRDFDVAIPPEFSKEDQVQVNIWICQDQVLRLVFNPFKPTSIPYHVVPYELNPYSVFGVGVADNMEDTQLLMNGFMRMAVDNAALSGNLVLEVDEDALVPGQNTTLYPGKVFRRQGGQPGQSIYGIKFPNVSNENMQLFDKARVLADESTGLPSFAHGQTGVTGIGRTSSGISMLMSAAHGSIRTVIKNFDDYLLGPLGRGYYYFNMQFDFDKELVGDLEVKARGTESLMANEIHRQRLMQLLSLVMNPMLAPFAKMDYILSAIAKSLDLDPDQVVNNMGDAAIQAKILQGLQASMTPPDQQGQKQGPPGVSDTQGSGNGNMGMGSVSLPGEQGFSGNAGGQGVPQGAG